MRLRAPVGRARPHHQAASLPRRARRRPDLPRRASRRRRRDGRRIDRGQGHRLRRDVVHGTGRQAVHDRLRQRGPGRPAQRRAQGRHGCRRLQGRGLQRRRDTRLRRPGAAGRHLPVRVQHPPEHDGDGDAPVGSARSCRDDRSSSHSSSRPAPPSGSCSWSALGTDRRPRRCRPAGAGDGRDDARRGGIRPGEPSRQARRRQLLGPELRPLSRRVPAAGGEAGRARGRRAHRRRRPDRRSGRAGARLRRPSTAVSGRRWSIPTRRSRAPTGWSPGRRPTSSTGPGSSARSRSAS